MFDKEKIKSIFGSDRSPRRGNVVCACVNFLKRTWKRSSRERVQMQERKQAGKASKQESKKASKQANKQVGKQV